jgi:hypothetical protein
MCQACESAKQTLPKKCIADLADGEYAYAAFANAEHLIPIQVRMVGGRRTLCDPDNPNIKPTSYVAISAPEKVTGY